MSATATTDERQESGATEPIRARRRLARKLRWLMQVNGTTTADYLDAHLGPQIEKDWLALPEGFRKHVETLLD
jgi:hypothetical protein